MRVLHIPSPEDDATAGHGHVCRSCGRFRRVHVIGSRDLLGKEGTRHAFHRIDSQYRPG